MYHPTYRKNRHLKSSWCPSGKKPYRDAKEAKEAIKNVAMGLYRGTLTDTGKAAVRWYRCPQCHYHHLTSRA